MSDSHPRIASRARLKRVLLISGSAGFFLALSLSAHAGEKVAALECPGFCRPIDSHQLETYRAEGEVGNQAKAPTRLSVILWDENRRMLPPAGAAGTVTSPSSTPVTITPPNVNPAPVPVLVH